MQQLSLILSYRSFGLPVRDIQELLKNDEPGSQPRLLKEHFSKLEKEICRLREQQRAILAMMGDATEIRGNGLTKQRWVDIMKASGFDEGAMWEWHRKFEELEPTEHQAFLETLGIGEQEIKRIRGLATDTG